MFISSCYFIQNARREAAAEKESDIVLQMRFGMFQLEIQGKEMAEKSNF